MTNDISHSRLETWLHEYDKLKDEAIARVGFRDNLIYATLAAYGAIASFAATNHYHALLVLPWASVVLGWTYLANDRMISAIGHYFRDHLSQKIAPLIGVIDARFVFGWGVFHRQRWKRVFQLIIDQMTFVLSGMVALFAYWVLTGITHWAIGALISVEAVLLSVLAVGLVVGVDWKTDASLPSTAPKAVQPDTDSELPAE